MHNFYHLFINFIKITGTLSIIYFCFQPIKSQNLIPDSSFENNKYIPTEFSAINASYSWDRPSWGTSDLFCKSDGKQKKYSLVDVPENLMGKQEAHSGKCYAGIFAFSHGQYREYLQTKLKQPLEKNKTYIFTMYISMADYSATSIDQLGVCFLKKIANYNSSNVITDLNPSYVKIEREIDKDISNWHRLSVTYKAHGGEFFVLIGSFEIHKIKKTKLKAPKGIKTRINQNSERDSYYYIDDVSLFETFVNIKEPILDAKTLSNASISLDTTFTFKNVLFKSNQALLIPSSYSELIFLIKYLKKNPLLKIEIIGHTDNSGDEKINLKLSLNRAKTVANFLIANGVDTNLIIYKGYGSTKPITLNENEEGKRKNRRVEFIIKNNIIRP